MPPARYVAHPREGVLLKDPRTARGEYPTVFVAAGRHPPSRQPEGKVVALPYAELVDNAGRPRPASELWTRIDKAGVPRLAQLVVFADDPAEAAVDYYVFRLMGWPDVKVWVY